MYLKRHYCRTHIEYSLASDLRPCAFSMFPGTSSLNDDGDQVFTLIWSFKKGRKRLWCSNYNVVYTDDNRCFKNCATLGVF